MRFEHWVYTIPLRLRSLFRRDPVDAELDEELRDHIERQTEENLARGMSAEEARRAALIALGGVEQRKQQCRETRGVYWIDDLARDLIYGLRTMRRNPGCPGDWRQHRHLQRRPRTTLPDPAIQESRPVG